MKQRVPLLIGVGCVGVIVWVVVMRSQPRQGPAPEQTISSVAAPIQAQVSGPEQEAPAPAGGETIVYTFSDEEQLRAFAGVWQDRQNKVLRMSVLQTYWNNEQAALAQLNNQLTTDYTVDPAKNYTLDSEQRALIEQGPPAQSAGEATGTPPEATQAQGQPVAENRQVVHTFADDEAMRAFSTLWQQHQGVVLRMRVIESYWNEDQAAMGELNGKLAADYHLDPTKRYLLDGQRRVIVEVAGQPTAPAAVGESAAPVLPDAGPTPDVVPPAPQ